MSSASLAVTKATPAKTYACNICQRNFVRSEHLERHRRTHTKDKPFQCEHCSEKFSRTDLRRRHTLARHSHDASQESPAGDGDGHAQKKLRTKNACDGCNSKKLRCSSVRPCERCLGKGIECLVSGDRLVTLGADAPASRESQGDIYTFHGMPQVNENAVIDRPSSQSVPQQRATYPTHEIEEIQLNWADAPGAREIPHEEVPSLQGHQLPTSGPPGTDFSQSNDIPGQHSSTPATVDFDVNWINEPLFSVTQGLDTFYESMQSLCDLVPAAGTVDYAFEDLSYMNWNMNDQLSYNPLTLQDAFSVDSLSVDLGNSITSPQAVTLRLHNHDASSAKAPRSDAFLQFENVSESLLSRPTSPSTIQARQRWFSATKNDDVSISIMQDTELINEFIWLFQDNIADSFSLFRDQDVQITRHTRKEWYLSMAAVGGLFCGTPGALKVSQWLYHSARQILLSYVCTRASQKFSVAEGLSILETFVLLQLFGYLCGDKRIYELIEVLHLHMIQTASGLGVYKTNGPENEKFKRVREALLVLDSYRVVLLQGPPGTPFADIFPAQRTTSSPDSHELADLLVRITRPGSFHDMLDHVPESFELLCTLSLLTWNIAPQPFISQTDEGRLWKSPFCEIALEQWRNAHDVIPDASTMVFFHTIHLNMFVCLPDVQSFAAKFLAREYGSGPERNGRRTRDQDTLSADRKAIRAQFGTDMDRQKAIWHAKQVLKFAELLIEVQDGMDAASSAEEEENPGSTRKRVQSRAPHLSHCVCFAALTLWCDSLLSAGPDEQPSTSSLLRGIEILSNTGQKRSHIEDKFRSILTEISKYTGKWK